MNLTYKGLEDLLATLHRIAPGKRTALQGRIKHFQRLGWPGGTNTGKGRAATYSFGAILRLIVGFELLQLGVTPERAVWLLRDNWDYIVTALSLVHSVRMTEYEDQDKFDVLLYCDPNALSNLSSDDGIDDTFFYTSVPAMARDLTENLRIPVRRLALINLSRLASDLQAAAGHPPRFDQDWRAWYEDERGPEREAYKNEHGAYPEEHGVFDVSDKEPDHDRRLWPRQISSGPSFKERLKE